jgi:NADH pyrophosphatase NudC (nudix superfamily)
MSLRDNHAALEETVKQALRHEFPQVDEPALADRAQGLTAIAEAFDMRIGRLLQWIHTRIPGKQWSGQELTRYCQQLENDRKALAEKHRALDICPECGTPFYDAQAAAAHVCESQP